MSKPKNKQSIGEQTKINPPTPGRGRHFMLNDEKAVLYHPRKELWKFLFSYLKPYRRKFELYLLLLILATAITSFNLIIVANIIDYGIIARDNIYLLNMTIIYLLLIFFIGITTYIAHKGLGIASQRIVFEIRNNLFLKLQEMSLEYFDQRSSGDIISVLTNDIDQLNQLVSGQFVMIITGIVSIVLSIIFMYMLSPLLATLSLIVFPIFFVLMVIFKKIIIGAFKETRKTISKVTSSIQENIEGAKVVQAYGQEEKKTSEFDKANKANYEVTVKVRKILATVIPLISLITTIITVSIIVVGGFIILGNVSIFGAVVTVGVLSAFIMILANFFHPFMRIMNIQSIIEAALASTDRIYSVLEEKVEIPDPKNPKSFTAIKGEVEFVDVSFGYRVDANKGKESEPEKIFTTPMVQKMMSQNPLQQKVFVLNMVNRLEMMLRTQTNLKQSSGGGLVSGGGNIMGGGKMGMKSPQEMVRMLASMTIPPELFEQFPKIVEETIKEQKKLMQHHHSRGYVLNKFNLKIPSGTTLAIVGETGAGKTTIINLLSRFYDINKGNIKIDGINIRDIEKTKLRNFIGMVPQDAFLFTGTIRANLLYAFGKPTAELEQKMIEVSKFLGLHNFIETLHKKYETKLKENGANISIGQRQLISFARALIPDPKILILDEATSSVDPYTETLIQDALDKARKGRTTIIIAHRLSTIKNADHIIVLDSENHNIIEEGSHDSLMALNGKYKRLLDMQYREIASDN